jgi:hypothetical protein
MKWKRDHVLNYCVLSMSSGAVNAYVKSLGYRVFEQSLIAVKGETNFMVLHTSDTCPYLTQISRQFNDIFKGTSLCRGDAMVTVKHPYVEDRHGARIITEDAAHPDVVRAATLPLPNIANYRVADTNASRRCGQVLDDKLFMGPDGTEKPLGDYGPGDNIYCTCQRTNLHVGRRPAAFVLEAKNFGEQALHCFACDTTKWIVGVFNPELAECKVVIMGEEPQMNTRIGGDFSVRDVYKYKLYILDGPMGAGKTFYLALCVKYEHYPGATVCVPTFRRVSNSDLDLDLDLG